MIRGFGLLIAFLSAAVGGFMTLDMLTEHLGMLIGAGLLATSAPYAFCAASILTLIIFASIGIATAIRGKQENGPDQLDGREGRAPDPAP